jgi:hypothetical protein
MRIRWLLAVSLALTLLVSGGCADSYSHPSASFDSQLSALVQPYSFNFATWEINALSDDIRQKIVDRQPDSAYNSQSVMHYFSYVAQVNTLKSGLQAAQAEKIQGDIDRYEAKIKEAEDQAAALKPIAEQTIAYQITQTLADLDIHNPLGNGWFSLTFPPVNFKLEEPLYELIISPRDKIQRMDSITIKPDINTAQMEELESSVDNLNVSALVVQIGGLGFTFPTFVVENTDPQWTIETAAHEWLHQYLAFRPLGFHYILDLLGISKNYEIDTINETVANIFGREVGAMVYQRYYSEYLPPEAKAQGSPADSKFDFHAVMRDTRKKVDSLLAAGQINQAEKYMNEQQQFLASKGYHIRKLNQAYFAFYGTYADSPSSVDPIGANIQILKNQALSLKDFIDQASGLTSSQELTSLIEQYK